MSPKVSLHYFNLRGRGEFLRFLLEVGGVSYEEVGFGFDEWPAKKANYPFGVTPVLYWDDEEISQSMTIARFIAKKTGLAGANEVEFARADCVTENVSDLLVKYFEYRFNKDEAKKAEAGTKYVSELLPNFVKYNETFLKKNGGKFVNGRSLSFGDVAICFLFDLLRNEAELTSAGFSEAQRADIEKAVAGSGALAELNEAVKANPKVAAYLKDRKSKAFPF